jgi:hypothetical protein
VALLPTLVGRDEVVRWHIYPVYDLWPSWGIYVTSKICIFKFWCAWWYGNVVDAPPPSGSALFIKTKNHVRACPLLKHLCIHFIFAKIKQYTYESHCFKIHFHTYTRVQKQIHKLYITCVQMLGNAKIWPYYMYNIKSWIFSYKVIKDFLHHLDEVRTCLFQHHTSNWPKQ